MDDEDFTFETAPFPPEPLPEGKIYNKTIQTIVNCIVSLPTDPASPFVTLAASLPNPTSTSTQQQQQQESNNTNNNQNNNNSNSNSTADKIIDPQSGLVTIPGLQDNEVEHAREILRLYPAFSEVRRRIVPRLVNDEKFWQAYFCLLAIQTRYETRMEAAFGATGDGDGGGDFDENENGVSNHNRSDREMQSTMNARVVLRMPTSSSKFSSSKNIEQQQQQKKSSSSSLEADSPTTRIIPGKRLRIPPSLCITVKDGSSNAIDSSSSASGASGLMSTSSGGGMNNNGNMMAFGRASTSTMLMGKDLMTKHMRDEWRRSLNEMCDY